MLETQTGRVVISFSADCIVESTTGELIRCANRRRVGKPFCGDYVEWRRASEHDGVIEAITPRHNLLARPNYRGDMKGFAANVDLMVIVVAVRPEYDRAMIDRYLILAAHLDLAALIFVNKIDLLSGSERMALLGDLQDYDALGYPVVPGSTKADEGIPMLQDTLRGKTSVLVGQSGVGKSSLVQRLLPDLEVRVGALSQASGQGRHTTTETTLYHLPGGGDLIDSPGIRTLRVGHLSTAEIADGFRELRPFLGRCRFANCRHISEPECAVLNAVREGKVSPRRLASFHEVLQREE